MDPAELHSTLGHVEQHLEDLPASQSIPLVLPPQPIAATVQVSGPACLFLIPERYDGSPEHCKGFLMQCELFIRHNGALLATDSDRVDLSCFSLEKPETGLRHYTINTVQFSTLSPLLLSILRRCLTTPPRAEVLETSC